MRRGSDAGLDGGRTQAYYFAGVTAYLVSAYLAGARLNRSQVAVMTLVIIVYCALGAVGAFGNYSRVLDLAVEIRAMRRELPMNRLCRSFGLCVAALFLAAVAAAQAPAPYFDNTGRDDVLSGGVRMIPITTPKGSFRVWTKRVGNNPRIKVLLLHGGPGATHESWEAVDSYFPGAGIEYYYYDQLGSAYSDQPEDTDLWTTERFVEEVEQVRQALQLDAGNLYVVGASWGGILAIEYALKYQQHLKGLVISNMMSSVPDYNAYARDVLMPKMDQQALAEILALEDKKDFANPRYGALLMQHFYVEHILRMPPEQWPDPVMRALKKLNYPLYTLMQGPSEMGASGRLVEWDRFADLKKIKVPTLVIGARHDTMDPAHMERMTKELPRGRYLYCANGSHLAIYDDQHTYFDGLIRFLKDVDAGRF